MKKINLLTYLSFHVSNIILISIYLYPGSILGWLFYRDFQKQPQLTSDFVVLSSNHVYAFMILSVLGIFCYHKNKIKNLFIYLFSISIFLELLHTIIPHRSFEYQDLIGNFFGVFFIFISFKIYSLLKNKNDL